MKINFLNQPFVFVVFFCLALSCQKKLPRCKGNCADITIAGRVYDKTNQQPIAKQVVTQSLIPNGCMICGSYILPETTSGSDGYFQIKFSIDSSTLSSNHFVIKTKTPQNYLQFAFPVGSDSNYLEDYKDIEFYSPLDRVALQNIEFSFYPQTLLQINLHRNTPIVSQQPAAFFDVKLGSDNVSAGILYLQQNAINKDTSINIYTGADVFSKITSLKSVDTANSIQKTDSIKCKRNVPNSIDVYY